MRTATYTVGGAIFDDKENSMERPTLRVQITAAPHFNSRRNREVGGTQDYCCKQPLSQAILAVSSKHDVHDSCKGVADHAQIVSHSIAQSEISDDPWRSL